MRSLRPACAAALAWFAALAGAPMASEIEAPGPLGPLRGTLTAPPPGAEGAAAMAPVLMIPGSGATDRDGNQAPAILAAPLRLLAEALAQAGIVSVRVDKRGTYGSRSAIADPEAVTLADYASDTAAWIEVIRAATGADCVFVLGHSEGGLVALKAAARADAGICGVILAATPGRPLGDILREQFEASLPARPLRAPTLAAIERILVALEAGRPADVSEVNPRLAAIFRPSVQPYLIDILAHDPARMIRATQVPVLILQGTTDLQVGVTDAQILARARPDARMVVIEGANHMFKPAPAERSANLAAYATPDLPLADGTADAIIRFLRDSTAAAPGEHLPGTESTPR